MDKRFLKINSVLTNYALGNFNQKVKPSARLDEIDAFIECVNMLGEELKEKTISRNHFNNIFNSVSDMIFVLNEEGRIQNFSKSVKTTLLYDSNFLKNRSIDYLLKKNQCTFFDSVQKLLKSKKRPIEAESQFKNATGEYLPVRCTLSYLFNELEKKIGYLLIVKDLSVIKKIEFSLKESEERYKKFFEESSDCVFIADKRGLFLELNRAGYQLLKINKNDKLCFFNCINSNEHRKKLKQKLDINKQVSSFNTQILCKDKSVLDCLISANSIFSENMKIIGYTGIIKNISKEKNAEKLLLKTIAETQENERKRFAKDIHDGLGQRLSAVKFYIGAIVETGTNEKQKKVLVKANNALIDALAEIRNICFDLMPKTLEHYGLYASIKELADQVGGSEKLKISVKSHANFPLLNKQLEIAIFRVVQEFFNNSLKHSNASSITIRLTATKRNGNIILADNGIGFQLDDMKNKKGLGLLNVKSRLKPYGGTIAIFTEANKGVNYIITIPLTEDNIKI